MARPRSLSGLLFGALGLGLVATGVVASPGASVPDRQIWGVAQDGHARPLLDVAVRAIGEDGVTAASALSYDDPDGDGAPRRGYFGLFPSSNGTYTVVLRKAGFVTERFPGVEIRRGQRVQGLGGIELLRTSATSGRLVKGTVPLGDRGRVRVTVAPTGTRPIGSVVVKEGRSKVGSATLRAVHKGEIAVTLDKLPRGSHDLKVVYGGSGVHQGSTSRRLTLTVKAAKRNRQVPSALAYLG